MSEQKLWVNLSEEDVQTLAALQADMGLGSPGEVMHALIRQAHTRATISCPACGHSAQLTAEDSARCDGCMSIMHLSDQIWTVVTTRQETA
jgi:uncharacterized Zn finger protein